jgi:lipopolysaccharide transport system ATP-binding protein
MTVSDVMIDFSDVHVRFSMSRSRAGRGLIGRRSDGKPLALPHKDVPALDGISMSIRPGERVGIVGPNGSGKSTLLRTIRGIFAPSQGSIRVAGSVQSFFNIGFGMNEDATGYENILLRGVLLGATPGEMNARMEEIAEFTELGAFLDMPIRGYSTGMRMRLAFGVSTSFSCDILLMDEWLSVGDVEFRKRAGDRLLALVDQVPIMVIASHNPELLERICTRIIRLEHGVVVVDRQT